MPQAPDADGDPCRSRVALPVADVEVDAVTEAEVVDRIVASASAGQGGLVVTPNVDHLRQIAAGSWLAAVYAEADLVVADGMPLIWASRLQGDPLPERVTGSDLLGSLSEAAARRGLPVYFLGGAPGAADETARRFSQRWPGLEVAGTSCPPKGFERRRGGVDAVVAEVAAAAPAIVFVALGAPKQELLSLELRRHLPNAWFLGVGAAFDMAAGRVQRAPVWARRLGVEWVFRLVQEPGRMARRYLIEDIPFALRLLSAAAAVGRARSR